MRIIEIRMLIWYDIKTRRSTMYIPTLIDPESDNLIDRHRKHLWGPKQHSKQTKPCAVEPPRHRAFFVLWRLAEYPDSEPENPGNPHKQRKKQRKQDSSRGACGWAGWMRLWWVCWESDCWKVIWVAVLAMWRRSKILSFLAVLRFNEVGSRQHMYITTLIDRESDNLIERHRGLLWGPNNIEKPRSPVLWNPHGIGLFLYAGALPNTLTQSLKIPETRINKGKIKEGVGNLLTPSYENSYFVEIISREHSPW